MIIIIVLVVLSDNPAGFTQPVVVSEEKDHYLVVDSYHR